jgi:glycosyltransferase involved in cell wall biosynthesis
MTTYTSKRIALLVARNNFVYRGVGAYCKSILDWALSQGHTIDVISDNYVRDNGLFDAYRDQVNWYQPSDIIEEKNWRELSAFKNSFNTELSLNFRNGLIRALRKHSYDLVITNVGEALHAVTSIGLHKVTTVLHPTHHESEAGVPMAHNMFAPGVTDVFQSLCSLPDVHLACQSTWVQQHCQAYTGKTDECAVVAPIVPELGLLDFDKLPQTQWGVGFVGPWEPRKNPEAYIEALKQAGLPGVAIVPSDTSAEKFKQKFKEAGIEYKIYVGVTGDEKTQIIRGLAAAYHPAISETFGLGALETAHTCPTILLADYDWSHVHADYCTVVNKDAVADTLKSLYGKGVSDATKVALEQRHQQAVATLEGFLNRIKDTKRTKNSFYEQLDTDQLVHHEQFVNELPSFCTDEIYKLARACYQEGVDTLHSKGGTYYRITGCGVEPQEDSDVFSKLFG